MTRRSVEFFSDDFNNSYRRVVERPERTNISMVNIIFRLNSMQRIYLPLIYTRKSYFIYCDKKLHADVVYTLKNYLLAY